MIKLFIITNVLNKEEINSFKLCDKYKTSNELSHKIIKYNFFNNTLKSVSGDSIFLYEFNRLYISYINGNQIFINT